jgi:hypothetical protein
MIKIKFAVAMSKNAMFIFLLLIIGIGVLSLSVFTNAEASSGYTSVAGSDSRTGVKQMGICVIDVESPCNGVT